MTYSNSFFKVCTNPGIIFCNLKYLSIEIQSCIRQYYQSRYNLCIRQCLSFKIQPLYSSVPINRDTTSVFISIYQSRYNFYFRQYLTIKIQPLYLSVSINRHTASVFINIFQSRYNICICQYLSIKIQPLYSSEFL